MKAFIIIAIIVLFLTIHFKLKITGWKLNKLRNEDEILDYIKESMIRDNKKETEKNNEEKIIIEKVTPKYKLSKNQFHKK